MRVIIETDLDVIADQVRDYGWDADSDHDHIEGRLSDVVKAVVQTMHVEVNDQPALVVVK